MKEWYSMIKFICYERCGTCKKAEKYLKEHGIAYEKRLINEDNPTYEELKEWIPASNQPVNKWFNTSGTLYKTMGLKDKLKDMSEEEKLHLLASDGMLVKRPILIKNGHVLKGFKEEEWNELFNR